jgi:hypothetical protein
MREGERGVRERRRCFDRIKGSEKNNRSARPLGEVPPLRGDGHRLAPNSPAATSWEMSERPFLICGGPPI